MAQMCRSLFKCSPALAILALVAFGSTSAWATSIPIGPLGGILDIGNSPGVLVGVSTTGGGQVGCINWLTPIGGSASPCSTSIVDSMSVSGGDPADFTVPSTGTIRDIPQGTAFISQFESVSSPLGTVFFDLTSIPAATPPASNDCSSGNVGSVCVPPSSPFTFLQKTSNQVDVSLAATLEAYTGSSSTGETPYNAIFSTTLSGKLSDGSQVTIPDILNLEFNEHGTITSTWSASESPAPVPEPVFSWFAGAGLVSIFLARRRQSRSRSQQA